MAELDDVLEALNDLKRLAPRVAYRVEDAAAQVGVSRSALYKMVDDGKVRKVPNMGSRVIIPHTELERVFGGAERWRGAA